MLNSIIKAVTDKLTEHGAASVYSAFDSVPVERKGNGIFTVVGISSFESTTPIYSLYTVYLPFRTELEIKATAPADCPLRELYRYFAEKIEPAVAELSGLSCSLKRAAIKLDTNINRLVLTAVVSAGGMTKIERSDTQNDD